MYRINKGIFDISEDEALNDTMDERRRRVPFSNMIYIGDGLTDVPSMKVTKLNGGHSIGVYADEQENACKMMKAGRINFMAKADYTKDSELMRIVKRIVDMLAAENDLMELSLSQYDKSKENFWYLGFRADESRRFFMDFSNSTKPETNLTEAV